MKVTFTVQYIDPNNRRFLGRKWSAKEEVYLSDTPNSAEIIGKMVNIIAKYESFGYNSVSVSVPNSLKKYMGDNFNVS